MVKIASLTVSKLKEHLAANDLSTAGAKSELVGRLTEFLGTDEIERPAENDHLQKQIDELKQLMGRFTIFVQNTIARNETTPNTTETVEAEVNQTVIEQVNNQSSSLPAVSVASDVHTWSTHSVKEIAETLPIFDPTDDMSMSVEQFVERVNASHSAYCWNPKSLLLAVYIKLKGAAKLWFDSSESFSTSWNELQLALIEEFSQQLDETEIHRKMASAVRETNETVEDYCFRIAALGRKFKLSDQAIIKHTRDGLHHRGLQSAIAAMRFETMKDMREGCLQYLRNQPTNRYAANSQQVTNYTRNGNTEVDTQKNAKPLRNIQKEMRCYNCFEDGHFSFNCPKPQRRRRCNDSQKVHSKGEPQNCGKKIVVNRRTKAGDSIFTKIIHIGDVALAAFVDTGSQYNMIRKSRAETLPAQKQKCTMTIQGIGGGIKYINEKIEVNINIDGLDVLTILYVVDDNVVDDDVLLGQDIFLEHEGMKAIVENGAVKFHVARVDVADQIINTVQCGDFQDDDKECLVRLVNSYRDCFATNLSEVGRTDLVTLKIELDTDIPIAQNPYRIPQPKRAVVTDMINDLLAADVIQPSESEYASPITLVKKKDGSDRFCVDYRRLNQHVRKEIYPMPNIEERLQDAKQYKLFTTFDLNSGYYQIPVDEDSVKYTAFITPEGLYEFKRMPFGLRKAPMAFQRLMSKLKAMLPPDDMLNYMDDILIGAQTKAELWEKTERVLKALRNGGLTLNPKKCSFLFSTISFLGHKLTPAGIEPGEIKTAAIAHFKIPESVTEVRRFLGLSGYFRKFVPAYAIISEPIRQLLKKGELFHWGTRQNDAFEMLKKMLISSPVLVAFDVNADQHLHTDASAIGLAAVLMQETLEGWKPVAYYSRPTSSGEKTMHSYELETLAVVEGLERFRYYIYGKAITVVTDCSAVTATWRKREIIPRIARWWLKVQDYHIIMEHRTEARMCHVDALSRAPDEEARDIEPATLRIDRADIAEADWLFSMQMQDDNIQADIQRVIEGDKQAAKEYTVDNGRLYKKMYGKKLWVVPKNLRYKITQETHENGGHLSVDRTIERMLQLLWFPRMRNIVKSFLRSCIQCAYNKYSGGKTEGEYHFSDIDAIPFKVIHADHLGPFPRSKKRNEHILVLVDAFTKYVFMRAVPNTSTKFVLKVINELTSFVGIPEKIISDRGTAFTSKDFQKYCKDKAVKHVQTAVRTPRANGQVERTNRTILSMLLPMSEKNNCWDEKLQTIQWSINSTMNATTKQTPHDLLFGFKPRDILGNQLTLILHDFNTEPTERETRQDDLKSQREAAVKRISTARKKAKIRFDGRHAKPKQYSCGDLVLVKNETPSIHTSRKLEPRFKGPFIVTSVLGNDRYVVEDLPGSQRKQRHYNSVHASDAMKLWCILPPDDIMPEDNVVDEDVDE